MQNTKYRVSGERIARFNVHALLWADMLVCAALFVMQDYLTDVWKLSFTHAAGILNIWNGIKLVLPFFLRILVDELLGNRAMLWITGIAYSLGVGFITMSVPAVLANSPGTCKQYEKLCVGRTQESLFYTGMALIAVGAAGILVSFRSFIDEQQLETFWTRACDAVIVRIASKILMPVIVGLGLAVEEIGPWALPLTSQKLQPRFG